MRVLVLVAVLALGVAACSSTPPVDDGVAAYCSVAAATAAPMAGTDPNTKRPAMARLRDAAPSELRADWDVVFAVEGDATTRDLARGRIDAFEAEHC